MCQLRAVGRSRCPDGSKYRDVRGDKGLFLCVTDEFGSDTPVVCQRLDPPGRPISGFVSRGFPTISVGVAR